MGKFIGLLVVTGVLLVAAFFLGYVVGTTVSPLQQPVETSAQAAVIGVIGHG